MTSERKKFRTGREILDAQDLKTEDVYVEDWQAWVRVRVMPGTERETWEQAMVKLRDEKKLENFRAWLVAQTAVDEAGARLFTDEDIPALGRKSGRALQTLFEVAQRLNGLREKDVEDLEGNSKPGLSGAPGSGSR